MVCSFLLYLLSRAYYHQLLDPNMSRQPGIESAATTAASDRYRMDALNHGVPYSSTHDPAFIPPYAPNTGHAAPLSAAGYAPPPPTYDAPAYAPPLEKGPQAMGDRKGEGGENDEDPFDDRKDGFRINDTDRDLESHVEHNNNNNSSSSNLVPGRLGEGRI